VLGVRKKQKITLPGHGVLIQFGGIGVYLIGDSGVGKSETALELIHCGAKLICDDAPDFSCQRNQHTNDLELLGSCPEGFYGLMHLRDLGIINIIEQLGERCVKKSQRIDFVIELIHTDNSPLTETFATAQYQHWQAPYQQEQHSWTIPGIRIHLYRNRNIPLLIKTAIMQFIQNQQTTK